MLHPPLAELIDAAAARARAVGHPVLVSAVESVASRDPLAVLEGLAADVPESPTPTADRMFWHRAADDFSFAAIGAAHQLAHEGADRFIAIERGWNSLLRDVVTNAPADCPPGVGPVAVGGFAFDAKRARGDQWSGFPAALLTVPRLLVTRRGDQCWCTTNVIVGTDGGTDVSLDALHALRRSALAHEPPRAAPAPSLTLSTSDVMPAAEWRARVAHAAATVRDGALDKVVLAREVQVIADGGLDPFAILRHLRLAQPSAFVFGRWRGTSVFLGATPERLVRLDGSAVQASSLAGSVRRGGTTSDDAALAAGLLASAKDRREHELVRRALCDALADLCANVSAPREPSLLSLPNVHHLHTPVTAQLRPGRSLLGLLAVLHPTPAVGGVPREAAMRYIREHEGLDRGWYAGPVGWLQPGHGEFAVALRSGLVHGHEARLFAGCGILGDSDPDHEYAESETKLLALRQAIRAAAAGEHPAGSSAFAAASR